MNVFAAACLLVGQTEDRGRMDVVFCIDRSGSMQGVIAAAKQKVWAIVNEMARAKPSPILRIGLLGYGTSDRALEFFPLTDDLDKVYESLMTFKVDMGGEEWVGWAAKKAADRMEWSRDPKALKVIFMIGNETAAQGPAEVLYTRTVPEIIKKDIVVNAVYCGVPSPEEERTWRELARLADGTYTQIELSGGAISIETPMDKKLVELNQKLNGTYLAFGRHGADGKARQELQDANSAASGGAGNLALRAAAKSKDVYDARGWDLVDAAKDKNFKLDELKEAELPAEMRAMTPEQRKAHVEKVRQEREALQKEIHEVDTQRTQHLQEEIKKR